jgi:hypothetical protein
MIRSKDACCGEQQGRQKQVEKLLPVLAKPIHEAGLFAGSGVSQSFATPLPILPRNRPLLRKKTRKPKVFNVSTQNAIESKKGTGSSAALGCHVFDLWS